MCGSDKNLPSYRPRKHALVWVNATSHCKFDLYRRLSQAKRAAVDDAHARRRPEATHLTEQRGTHNWPEAERYYVCRRRDEASLACLRTHELVYRRAGRRWARAWQELERSRGSR